MAFPAASASGVTTSRRESRSTCSRTISASSLAQAEKLGGKTVLPPTQAEGGPELAMLADPQGNLIGLVKG